MPLWDDLAGLQVRVDDYSLQRRELQVGDRFTRVTTTVLLAGDGESGEGEDVTYDAAQHDEFPAELMLAGTWSLDDLSRQLDEFELSNHRRWAFESAALDLALRHAERSLADVVVAGTPTLRTPEGERELRPGDVVGFPQGEDGAHTFTNRGGGPARS